MVKNVVIIIFLSIVIDIVDIIYFINFIIDIPLVSSVLVIDVEIIVVIIWDNKR